MPVAPTVVGRSLLLLLLVLQSGCIWTYRGQPYPAAPAWPPQPAPSEKTLGILITAEDASNGQSVEDIRDLLCAAESAAYQAFKESGRFNSVGLNRREHVDYLAQIKVARQQTDRAAWWTLASLFLIPASGEVRNDVTLELLTGDGKSVGTYTQTAVHGGYMQLLLLLAFPIEILGSPYSTDRALADTFRALVAEAIRGQAL
jgi:hypothetical protein